MNVVRKYMVMTPGDIRYQDSLLFMQHSHAVFMCVRRFFPTPSPFHSIQSYSFYIVVYVCMYVFGRPQNSKAKAIKLLCEET